MYKVILKRVISGKYSGLRTNEIHGECNKLPEINKEFVMTSKPLDPTVGNIRVIETTRIKELMDPLCNPISFTTESGSEYTLQILKDSSN